MATKLNPKFFSSWSMLRPDAGAGSLDPFVTDELSMATQPRMNEMNMNANASAAAAAEPPAPPSPYDALYDQEMAAIRRSNQRTEELANQLTQQEMANIAAEQGNLAGQEDFARRYAALPGQMDLSPVARLLDSWYGTNTGGAYAPKETPQSRMQQIQELQAGINKARGNLSESQVSLIKNRLNNQIMMDQNARKLLEAKLGKKQAQESSKEKTDLKVEEQAQRMRDRVLKQEPRLSGAISFRQNVQALRDFIANNQNIPLTDPRYQQLFNAAKVDAKDARELGAITNSDTSLISGLLGPESMWEVVKADLFKDGPGGAIAALDQTIAQADNAYSRRIRGLRIGNPTAAAKPVIDEFEQQYKGVAGPGAAGESVNEKLLKALGE